MAEELDGDQKTDIKPVEKRYQPAEAPKRQKKEEDKVPAMPPGGMDGMGGMGGMY